MSNISNTDSTFTSGGIDTRTTLDGTYDATFQQMNGAASGVVAIETILGDGPTLKGNKADLATRLATALDADGAIIGGTLDARTNTVADGARYFAETSGTPANGIGTALLLQAESQDETPSDVVRFGGYFTDVATGSEDSRFIVYLRIAGAALAQVWNWAATTAFKGIFTHSNSADRTYTLPDATTFLNDSLRGPQSTGSGSTAAHEGTVQISASQALSGIHHYTDFTLDAGDTITIDNDTGRLVIVATGVITINGTIDGIGAGGAGGGAGVDGTPGSTNPGGGGGQGNAGGTTGDGGATSFSRGGQGATGAGTNGGVGTELTGNNAFFSDPYSLFGGAGGGGGDVGAGGRGGASIILIAPTIVLGAAAVLNTSGSNGTGGNGAGGGGSAGNILIMARSYTDSGATFTMTAGSGGAGSGGGGNGGNGYAGNKQINIYA